MEQINDIKGNMLFPLFGRALYIQNHEEEFIDEKTKEIFNLLKSEHKILLRSIDETAQIGSVARALTIDIMLNNYILTHPRATILNIGAGFDTHFSRVDNGTIIYYNLDVPDAISFRKQYFIDSPRCISIANSVFDYSWIKKIQFNPNYGMLIIAAGVFHYFKESEVKFLIRKLSNTFLGSELLFDVVTSMGKESINQNIQHLKEKNIEVDAEMEWFLDNVLDFCETNEKLELLEEFSFSEKLPNNSKIKEKVEFNSFFNSKSNLAKFIHLKFKSF